MAKRTVKWTRTADIQYVGILEYWVKRNKSNNYSKQLIEIVAERTKEIVASKAVYKVYAGNPSDDKLKSIDGEETSNYDIMLNCLEAGDSAYIERNQSYENLRS